MINGIKRAGIRNFKGSFTRGKKDLKCELMEIF
jgi:hypothetical protein